MQQHGNPPRINGGWHNICGHDVQIRLPDGVLVIPAAEDEKATVEWERVKVASNPFPFEVTRGRCTIKGMPDMPALHEDGMGLIVSREVGIAIMRGVDSGYDHCGDTFMPAVDSRLLESGAIVTDSLELVVDV